MRASVAFGLAAAAAIAWGGLVNAQTVPYWAPSGGALAPQAGTAAAVTGAIKVSSGTTGQRPGTPAAGMMRYNTTTSKWEFRTGAAWENPVWETTSGIFQPLDATLTSLAATGTADKSVYYSATDTAAEYDLTAAARTVLDDASVSAMVDTLGGAAATGSGGLVRATSPTLVTPLLGTPTSGTLTNCTGLPIASGVSGLAANVATALETPSSANLAAAVTNETGSGALVFATSPTLVTPVLGTPTSGDLSNCWYPGKLIGYSCVETSETTTSTTNADLTTAQSVTFTAPSNGNIWVVGDCDSVNSSIGNANEIAFDLDGTDVTARRVITKVLNSPDSMSRGMAIAVTSGSRTVKLQFRVTAGTGTFVRRSLVVYWAP